jgi:hypothetical protein
MIWNYKANGILVSGVILGLSSVSFIENVDGMTNLFIGPHQVSASASTNETLRADLDSSNKIIDQYYLILDCFAKLPSSPQPLNRNLNDGNLEKAALQGRLLALANAVNIKIKEKENALDQEDEIVTFRDDGNLLLESLILIEEKDLSGITLNGSYGNFITAITGDGSLLYNTPNASDKLNKLVDEFYNFDGDFASLPITRDGDLGDDLVLRWHLLRSIAALAERGDISADENSVNNSIGYNFKTILAIAHLLKGL